MDEIIKADMTDIYSRSVDWERLNNSTIMLTGAYGMLTSYVTYFVYYLIVSTMPISS